MGVDMVVEPGEIDVRGDEALPHKRMELVLKADVFPS